MNDIIDNELKSFSDLYSVFIQLSIRAFNCAPKSDLSTSITATLHYFVTLLIRFP